MKCMLLLIITGTAPALSAQTLFRFEKNQKYGFRDAADHIIVSAIYDNASPSITTLGGVRNKDGWAVMNNKGQVLTPFAYNGGVGDAKGFDLVPVERALGLMGANHYFGIVDRNGREIAKPEYSFVEILSNDLAVVAMFDKYGIINSRNQFVVPLQYSKETLVVFTNIQPNGAYYQDGKWQAFSFEGSGLRKWKYDNIILSGEYLWPVEYHNKWGFADTLGREIVAPAYDSVGTYSNGIAWVAVKGQKGVMDKTGKLVLPVQFEHISLYRDSNFLVSADGKYGVLNSRGSVIIPVTYSAIQPFREELAAIQLEGKWGFADVSGKVVIAPQYDGVLGFSDGLAAVALRKKIGFINKEGKVVIEPRFDDVVEPFYKGKAIVIRDGKEIYIDSTGKEIN